MTVRLYVTSLSTPSKAVAAMLAHKRLAYRLVTLTAGFHPLLVRAAGFSDRTVPALELDDGRRIQGSLAISRVLDEVVPERPLFPSGPVARRAVEDAERWGHDELQPIPRRLFRRAAATDVSLRRWVASEVAGVPAPALAATLTKPLVVRLSRDAGNSETLIRDDVTRLPALLDRADALIAAGTIGAAAPNAADVQILSSVRVLLDFKALPPAEHRTSAQAARRLFPVWEGELPWFEIPGT